MISGHLRSKFVASAFCVAVQVVIWWSGSASLAAPVLLPDEVRAALKANAEGLNPTTAVWEMRRTTPLSPGDVAEKLKFKGPPSEYVKEEVVHYCWQDGMTYSRILSNSYVRSPSGKVDLRDYGAKWAVPKSETPKPGKVVEPPDKPRIKVSEVQEMAIDLVNWYNGTGEKPQDFEGRGSVILGIRPLQEARTKTPRAKLVRPEYFYQAGYTLPATPAEQGQSQQSLILARLDGEGDQLVGIDNVRIDKVMCLRVDVKAKDRIYRSYLDPNLNYALRRREEVTDDGRALCVADCSDFTRVDRSEHWLPRLCRVSYFQWHTNPKLINKEPLVLVTYTVKELDHQPIPTERFRLSYRQPGAYIADSTLPEAKNLKSGKVVYRIPANPAQLDAAIAAGKRGEDPKFIWSQRSRSLGIRFWLLAINGVLLGLALAIWVYSRMRHKQAHRPKGDTPQ